MAKQSRLESEAIQHRDVLLVKNDYMKGSEQEYNEEHKDARADGDPLGKGTGNPLGTAPRPGTTDNKAISYANVNTKDAGGQYDVEGRNGVGGRERLVAMNLYGPDSSYGLDSVDTTKNVEAGQYVVV